MKSEIEAKFLDVPQNLARQKLKLLGARLKQPQYLMKRAIYDYSDLRLDKEAAWIRIRQEADKATMGYKQRQSETIEGMREIEFSVGSYEKACGFLEAIGLKLKAIQESKREVWELNACEIMLDEWPWIPAYIEVEGSSESTVKATSRKLGFDFISAIFDSTDVIYQRYFNVSRTEISTIPIKFGPVPSWLEKRRR